MSALLTALALSLGAEPVPAVARPMSYAALFLTADDASAVPAQSRLEADLARRLASKGVSMLDLDARFPPPQLPSSDGERLIGEGKEAYDNLDTELAAQKLSEAALFFIRHPEVTDARRLAEVFFFLGAAQLSSGNREAPRQFSRAAILDPEFRADPKLFTPDVQKAWAKARSERDARRKIRITVETLPAGAVVELNGKVLGRSPVGPLELPLGRYHLRARRPGFTTVAQFPELTADSAETVSLELPPLPAFATSVDLAARLTNRNNFDAKVLPPQAAQLAQQLGARYLILGRVALVTSTTKADVQVWDVETGDRLRELKFDGDEFGMSNATETIKLWIDRPVSALVVEGQPNPVTQALKKPWIWVGLGVVVTGAAVGVAAVALQEPHRFNVATGIP